MRTEEEEEEEGGRGEREKRREHMDTGSLALAIHMPSHQMVVRVRTPEMSQPNAAHSLQITATDNKQLFTCWMRVGDETKVFLSLAANVPQNKRRPHSTLRHQKDFDLIYSNVLSFH